MMRLAVLTVAALLLVGLCRAQEANVWLFDLGAQDSPLWPGFTRVTPQTVWTAEQGYGWSSDPTPLRAYLAGNLDALAVDDISSTGNQMASFRVSVPDGEYTVWVLSGAMGNIWRLRYLRQEHQLLLQGQVVEIISPPEEKLFELANYEWSAGDDIWEKYIASRFTWHRHQVTVTGGALEIGFGTPVAFPVNAIIIARSDVAERVAAEIEKLDARRREAFYGLWTEQRPQDVPPLEASPAEVQRGYVVAEMHCSDQANPWSRPAPDASRERIQFFATPGEQEQASFGVFALRDLQDVAFTVSELKSDTGAALPAEALQLGLVQFAPWHAGRRDAPTYSIYECLILPLRPTRVGADTCKRFWITLNTPQDAAPGVYRGTISISARNAPPAALELRIRVVPIKLQTPPVERFMYFGTFYYLGKAYLPIMDEQRYWEAIRAEVHFMRDNQYCRAECIIPTGREYLTMDGDRVVDIDMSDTKRLMDIIREENAWPRDNTMICRTCPLNLKFGGHFQRPDNPDVEFIPTEEGREKYRQCIRLIEQKRQQYGWPEIAYECLGEFSNFGESGRKFAIEVHTLLHDLGVPNTLRGNGPSDMAAIELGLVRYPQPNHAMMHAHELEIMRRTGQRLWAYNFSRSRFSLGWFCIKHNITRASYESGVYANGQPGNLFDIDTMFPMGLPTSMTSIAPTVWLKRLVQGAVDYEYLWNLQRRIEAAEASRNDQAKRVAAQARQWLEGKLAELADAVDYVRGDPKADLDVQGGFWPPHDLDKYRWQAAEFIMTINEALGGAE